MKTLLYIKEPKKLTESFLRLEGSERTPNSSTICKRITEDISLEDHQRLFYV